mgnify:CR=1 FL=1
MVEVFVPSTEYMIRRLSMIQCTQGEVQTWEAWLGWTVGAPWMCLPLSMIGKMIP